MSYTVSTDIKRNSEAEKKGEKMEAKEKGEAKKGKDHEKKKEKDYEKRDYERKGLSLCVVAVGITVDGSQMLLSSSVCEIDLQFVDYRLV